MACGNEPSAGWSRRRDLCVWSWLWARSSGHWIVVCHLGSDVPQRRASLVTGARMAGQFVVSSLWRIRPFRFVVILGRGGIQAQPAWPGISGIGHDLEADRQAWKAKTRFSRLRIWATSIIWLYVRSRYTCPWDLSATRTEFRRAKWLMELCWWCIVQVFKSFKTKTPWRSQERLSRHLQKLTRQQIGLNSWALVICSAWHVVRPKLQLCASLWLGQSLGQHSCATMLVQASCWLQWWRSGWTGLQFNCSICTGCRQTGRRVPWECFRQALYAPVDQRGATSIGSTQAIDNDRRATFETPINALATTKTAQVFSSTAKIVTDRSVHIAEPREVERNSEGMLTISLYMGNECCKPMINVMAAFVMFMGVFSQNPPAGTAIVNPDPSAFEIVARYGGASTFGNGGAGVQCAGCIHFLCRYTLQLMTISLATGHPSMLLARGHFVIQSPRLLQGRPGRHHYWWWIEWNWRSQRSMECRSFCSADQEGEKAEKATWSYCSWWPRTWWESRKWRRRRPPRWWWRWRWRWEPLKLPASLRAMRAGLAGIVPDQKTWWTQTAQRRSCSGREWPLLLTKSAKYQWIFPQK